MIEELMWEGYNNFLLYLLYFLGLWMLLALIWDYHMLRTLYFKGKLKQ